MRFLILMGMSICLYSWANVQHEETIWVSKPDQSKLCEKGSGISLFKMKKELEQKGIKVLEFKKIYDPRPRIQSCGTPTGTANAYRINVEQKSKLGVDDHFEEVNIE